MKHFILIALGVLVPFALLIVVGFHWMPMAPVETPLPHGAAPPMTPTKNAAAFQSKRVEQAMPSAGPEVENIESAIPPIGVDTEPESQRDQILQGRVLPLLADLNPKAQECFERLRPSDPQPVTVTVKIDILASGRIARARLATSSWDEPRLTSCILNAVEATHAEPVGMDFVDQLHTFTLIPVGVSAE